MVRSLKWLLIGLLGITALVGCGTNKENDRKAENVESVEAAESIPAGEEASAFEYASGDDYTNQLALDTVKLEDDEEISGEEWVDDSHKCYRVSVQYKTAPDNAYQHKRDYFLFTDISVVPIIVDYPDKDNKDADRYVHDGCGFEAHFEDLTFDGNDDLLISLGDERTGDSFYCTYVYDEGQYVYIKSFEQIANYKLEYESNRVISIQGDAERSWAVYYEYNADKKAFVRIEDYEEAEQEFDEYIKSLNLPGIPEDFEFAWDSRAFDVTGDGSNDLIRFLFYGSGMPRTSVLVFDPVNHTGYILDDYNISYYLDSYSEDELLIRKCDSQYPEESAVGTLSIEDNELVWNEK